MKKRINYILLFLIIVTLSSLTGSKKSEGPPVLLDNTTVSDRHNTVVKEKEEPVKEPDTVVPDTPAPDAAVPETTAPSTERPNISTPDKEKVDAATRLSKMSLEEKVKQMLIAGCSNINTARSAAGSDIGGVCLYAGIFQNQDASGVRAQMDELQNRSSIPLLIGVDEEGGTVCRISSNPKLRPTRFLSPSELYKPGDWSLVESDTREKAQLLLSLGINFNFAPVCDVPLSTQDYIYPRCFSLNANLTKQYVSLVVSTMKEQGIGSSLKHFPGYGGSSDTHAGIAYDYRAREQFEQADFLPFASGISAGTNSVMVSHNIVTCMDPNLPASLSPEVHHILRERFSYNGVIMSDDLNMKAISQFTGGKDAAVQAVLAGNDMLICGANYDRSAAAVVAAVRDGTISQSQIDASVLRILQMKEQLNLPLYL